MIFEEDYLKTAGFISNKDKTAWFYPNGEQEIIWNNGQWIASSERINYREWFQSKCKELYGKFIR